MPANSMLRTQVYLSAPEKQSLNAIARATGKSQSVLIREAVHRLIHSYETLRSDRRQRIEQAAGIWKDRADLPGEFRRIRNELDRAL
jgi:predicted DNA-binding protein